MPKEEGFCCCCCSRGLAFGFNIPVCENQGCQLPFLHKQTMLCLLCVHSSSISERLMLIQAKICVRKRCLKSSVKLAEASKKTENVKIAINERDTCLTQNAHNSKPTEKNKLMTWKIR